MLGFKFEFSSVFFNFIGMWKTYVKKIEIMKRWSRSSAIQYNLKSSSVLQKINELFSRRFINQSQWYFLSRDGDDTRLSLDVGQRCFCCDLVYLCGRRR